MPESRRRHPLLKRITLWTTWGLLAFILYFACTPIVVWFVWPRFHFARPVLAVLYLPLDSYSHRLDWPGSESYRLYDDWCRNTFHPNLARPPDAE